MQYQKRDNLFTIQAGKTYRNKTIAQFLDDYHISKPMRYLYITEQRILLNDTVVKNPAEKIAENDVLTIVLPHEEPDWIIGEKSANIIYENDFVMVVHKDAGCIIHGDEDDRKCLNAQVASYLKASNKHTSVRPIHRLDKDTSGLVLYSKIPFFQSYFDNALQERKISRHYKAICTGKAPSKNSTFDINDRIGKDRHHSNRYRVSSSGKDALTHVTCLDIKDKYILFGCSLDTGRTHQIRVHLSAHHWPIVNDALYGAYSHDFERMCLWADSISFRDPISHKKHVIYDIENPDYTYFDAFKK